MKHVPFHCPIDVLLLEKHLPDDQGCSRTGKRVLPHNSFSAHFSHICLSRLLRWGEARVHLPVGDTTPIASSFASRLPINSLPVYSNFYSLIEMGIVIFKTIYSLYIVCTTEYVWKVENNSHLPPCMIQGLNSGYEAHAQGPLPTEPFQWTKFIGSWEEAG